VPLHLCVLKGLKCVLPHAMLESVEERGREQFEVVFYTLRHFDRASAHSVEWVVGSFTPVMGGERERHEVGGI